PPSLPTRSLRDALPTPPLPPGSRLTTLNDVTPHSAASRRSAGCHQTDGRVHLVPVGERGHEYRRPGEDLAAQRAPLPPLPLQPLRPLVLAEILHQVTCHDQLAV